MKQLPNGFEPFGRVRDSERTPTGKGALQLVGIDTETSALVRYDAYPPNWSKRKGPSEYAALRIPRGGERSPSVCVVSRARAQQRLPVQMRQQLIDAIYDGQPFRTVLRELGLTSNQVFGLAKTDEEWSMALEAALTASRRSDLQHGANAAYVAGCVCRECRDYRPGLRALWSDSAVCQSCSLR
jgi:hypothetical protein